MRIPRWLKRLAQVAGLILAAIGVAGIGEDLRTWKGWTGSVARFLNGDVTRTILVLVGVALLVGMTLIDRARSRTRSLSPLTGLPGNASIGQEVARRINAGEPVALIHADIDNLRSVNDYYGFDRGDKVIEFTATNLSQAAIDVGADSVLIGHAGGGEFRIVVDPSSAEEYCRDVVAKFDDGILDLYDRRDALRGYVELDGSNGTHAFPIVSISMGVATNHRRPFSSESQASAAASDMKGRAKSEPGSIFLPGGP